MKSLWNNEQFCRDTFEADLPDDFRKRAIASMARAARRARQTRRAAISAAVLVLISLTLTSTLKKPSQSPTIPAATVAQTPSWQIHSKAFEGIVHSQPLPESVFLRTPATARFYTEITDDQLLEYSSSQPVALVKFGATAQLEFLTP